MVNIVSLILARSGSKGIPKKNMVDLNGFPLIYYSIKASLNSKSHNTWVCSDDKEILKTGEFYGAKSLLRPKELAQDNSKSEESLLFFAEKIDFDILVFIQPTSPLLKSTYINQGINMVLYEEYDSVFSCFEEHWLPRWSKSVYPINWDINQRPMRQDVPSNYIENGAFYITKKTNLLNSKLRYSGKIGIVEMPFYESFQVDSENDLKFIREIMR